MAIWYQPLTLEMVNNRSKNTMVDYLGIEFIEIGNDYMVATMPIDHRTKQMMGIMHGGASCVLAETVGSTAANYCVNYPEVYCVGLDINTNHIHSVREHHVIGKAKPFHLGRSTQVWSIEITTPQGRLVSVNRLTMAVLTR